MIAASIRIVLSAMVYGCVATPQTPSNIEQRPVSLPELRVMDGLLNGWVGRETLKYEISARLGFYRDPVGWGPAPFGTLAVFGRDSVLDATHHYMGIKGQPLSRLDEEYIKHLAANEEFGVLIMNCEEFNRGVTGVDRRKVGKVMGMRSGTVWAVQEPVGRWAAESVAPFRDGCSWSMLVLCLRDHVFGITGDMERYVDGGLWRNTSHLPHGTVCVLAAKKLLVAGGPRQADYWRDVIESDVWLRAWAEAGKKVIDDIQGKDAALHMDEIVDEWARYSRVQIVLPREGLADLGDSRLLDLKKWTIRRGQAERSVPKGATWVREGGASAGESGLGELLVIRFASLVVVVDMKEETVRKVVVR